MNFLNVKKAIRYCKKNGLVSTYYTIRERMGQKKEPYAFFGVSEDAYEGQKMVVFSKQPMISILVPVYETRKEHFREMIQSVILQSYGKWELILADASPTNSLEKIVTELGDSRICYHKVATNQGISVNTNEALSLANGDFIALLDHDDVLTKDALFEMMLVLQEHRVKGKPISFLYSDEDKGNYNLTKFFEPHRKLAFNYDLFLSNNYICHFAMVSTGLAKELKFRSEYDGAQDYDFFLRVVASVPREEIAHVSKVLYHWRCHKGSTAVNPESKMYAYEAGRRAVADFLQKKGIEEVEVVHTEHLGFYGVEYGHDFFSKRKDVGARGGFYYKRNKIAGGAWDESGNLLYRGLHKNYSGTMHRAILQQDVAVLDIRTIQVAPEYKELRESLLQQYGITQDSQMETIEKASIELSNEIKREGKLLLLDAKFGLRNKMGY